jgi:heme-degrading monooxygenase HmoA
MMLAVNRRASDERKMRSLSAADRSAAYGDINPQRGKGESVMFARIVEFIPKVEKKEELFKVVRNEVLPILKKQPGFLEILPFLPESTTEKTITVTLWAEKRDAERYEQNVYPRVAEIVRPYLTTAITFKHYVVETSVCPNFMEALTA